MEKRRRVRRETEKLRDRLGQAWESLRGAADEVRSQVRGSQHVPSPSLVGKHPRAVALGALAGGLLVAALALALRKAAR
jgi:hypothetical protein